MFLIIITLQAVSVIATTRVTFSLYEEAPAYSYVGNVPQAAGLINSSAPALEYSLLSNANPDSDFFLIDEIDGVLRTRRKIDREVICPMQVSCELRVDAAAKRPPDIFVVVKISVQILDENDNKPTFAEMQMSRWIPENTQPGRSFSVPLAEDLDSPQFGVASYNDISGSTAFTVKVTEDGEGNPDGLHIVLAQELDREQKDTYYITLAATDKGVPPKTGTLALTINVQDVNDHPPQFTQTLFEVSIEENANVGSPVTRVTAEDKDQGENGEIVYSFDSRTVTDYGDLFKIDSVTGDISVAGDLDRETKEIYDLMVTAQDNQGEWLPSEAKVRVRLTDMNDNAPKVSIEAITSSGKVQIHEDEAPGSYIAFISVRDPDAGSNGVFTCSLQNPDFVLDTINEDQSEAEYTLETSRTLDHEVISQYDLKVICSDNGSPSLTSTTDISVQVLDINDNVPVFDQPFYSTDLVENSPRGTAVTIVTASDIDSGKNGRVTYDVESENPFFQVGRTDGKITTKTDIDYEEIQNFTLTIIASDQGSSPSSSSVRVNINVIDLNDEPPYFTLTKYTMGISEKAEFGSKVGQVTAEDPDSVSTGNPGYTIVGPADILNIFSVSQNSGEIFTKSTLDRETIPGYSFIVKAIDSIDDSLTSTTTVSIYVTDENDNAPIIDFPSLENNTIHIANTELIGQEVTRVRAHDNDANPANTIAYYITGDEDSLEHFSMNEATGQILTRQSLKPISFKIFHLDVLVRDSGSPPQTSTTQIFVRVNSSLSASPSQSLMASSNTIIVIAVVVISLILIILLITAIVVVKRNDDKLTKSASIRKMFAGQLVVAQGVDSKRMVEDGRSQGHLEYHQDVTMEDEEDGTKQIRQMSSDASLPKDSSSWPQFYGEQKSEHEADRDSGVSGADSDSGRCSNDEGDSSRPSFNVSMEQEPAPPRPPSRPRDKAPHQPAQIKYKPPPPTPMAHDVTRRSARDLPRSRRDMPPFQNQRPPCIPPKLNSSHVSLNSLDERKASSYV